MRTLRTTLATMTLFGAVAIASPSFADDTSTTTPPPATDGTATPAPSTSTTPSTPAPTTDSTDGQGSSGGSGH